ncbi:hypothetical protein BZA77DRAFT_299293 [Pyronema omphalodes]|nr:hypothetical protein BZA77DRAFT_299293 [Pyronema omphalodes]
MAILQISVHSLQHDSPEEQVEHKFCLVANGDWDLARLRNPICDNYRKLYPNEPPLRILKFQNKHGYDILLQHTPNEIFLADELTTTHGAFLRVIREPYLPEDAVNGIEHTEERPSKRQHLDSRIEAHQELEAEDMRTSPDLEHDPSMTLPDAHDMTGDGEITGFFLDSTPRPKDRRLSSLPQQAPNGTNSSPRPQWTPSLEPTLSQRRTSSSTKALYVRTTPSGKNLYNFPLSDEEQPSPQTNKPRSKKANRVSTSSSQVPETPSTQLVGELIRSSQDITIRHEQDSVMATPAIQESNLENLQPGPIDQEASEREEAGRRAAEAVMAREAAEKESPRKDELDELAREEEERLKRDGKASEGKEKQDLEAEKKKRAEQNKKRAEENKKKAEENRKKAEEKKKIAEEKKKKAEENKRKAEENKKKAAEKKKEEAERKKQLAEKKKQEAADKKKQEEEKKKQEVADKKKQEEEKSKQKVVEERKNQEDESMRATEVAATGRKARRKEAVVQKKLLEQEVQKAKEQAEFEPEDQPMLDVEVEPIAASEPQVTKKRGRRESGTNTDDTITNGNTKKPRTKSPARKETQPSSTPQTGGIMSPQTIPNSGAKRSNLKKDIPAAESASKQRHSVSFAEEIGNSQIPDSTPTPVPRLPIKNTPIICPLPVSAKVTVPVPLDSKKLASPKTVTPIALPAIAKSRVASKPTGGQKEAESDTSEDETDSDSEAESEDEAPPKPATVKTAAIAQPVTKPIAKPTAKPIVPKTVTPIPPPVITQTPATSKPTAVPATISKSPVTAQQTGNKKDAESDYSEYETDSESESEDEAPSKPVITQPTGGKKDAESNSSEYETGSDTESENEAPSKPATAKTSHMPQPFAAPIVTPAAGPVAKPTEVPMARPVAKSTEKPTVKPTEKPTEKPAVKPAAKPAAKPVGNAANGTATIPSSQVPVSAGSKASKETMQDVQNNTDVEMGDAPPVELPVVSPSSLQELLPSQQLHPSVKLTGPQVVSSDSESDSEDDGHTLSVLTQKPPQQDAKKPQQQIQTPSQQPTQKTPQQAVQKQNSSTTESDESGSEDGSGTETETESESESGEDSDAENGPSSALRALVKPKTVTPVSKPAPLKNIPLKAPESPAVGENTFARLGRLQALEQSHLSFNIQEGNTTFSQQTRASSPLKSQPMKFLESSDESEDSSSNSDSDSDSDSDDEEKTNASAVPNHKKAGSTKTKSKTVMGFKLSRLRR